MVVVTAALFIVGSVLARFVPVNTFSLYGMYRRECHAESGRRKGGSDRMLGQSSVMQIADGYSGDGGLPGFFKWAAKQSRRTGQLHPQAQPIG